jgi:hypothetical protein
MGRTILLTNNLTGCVKVCWKLGMTKHSENVLAHVLATFSSEAGRAPAL